MKVILLQDVKSLGKKGDIVEVNDGYARNYVLPKKLGIEANGKNLNDLKLQKAHEDKLAAQKLADAKELAAKLEAVSVKLSIKIGSNGKPFGAIASKELAEAVKKQTGIEVDKKKINLKDSIKETGTHEVTVKLHPQVSAKLKVEVAGE